MATCIYPDCVRYAETYTQLTWCCDLLCICKHSWMNICVCRLHDAHMIYLHIDSMDGTIYEKQPSDCNTYANLRSNVNISLVQRLAVTNTGVLIVYHLVKENIVITYLYRSEIIIINVCHLI